jgi:alkylation response protein AidB-like acyl-CoA dehydrogenase
MPQAALHAARQQSEQGCGAVSSVLRSRMKPYHNRLGYLLCGSRCAAADAIFSLRAQHPAASSEIKTMLAHRRIYNEEHAIFREVVRRFVADQITPNFARWEEQGIVEREYWVQGGLRSLRCPQVPTEFGGPGCDFKYNAIVGEEIAYAGYAGPLSDFSVHSDVCAGYLLHFGSTEQKLRWLPQMVSGESVCAIAMTEPGTGSDLQGIRTRAVRVGEEFVVTGAKTFTSNGQHADLVIVVARTSEAPGAKGISLILVEADRPGFRRGRNLDKLGHLSADTSELFFDDVRVPAANLLGTEDRGFSALVTELPQEQLTLAVLDGRRSTCTGHHVRVRALAQSLRPKRHGISEHAVCTGGCQSRSERRLGLLRSVSRASCAR